MMEVKAVPASEVVARWDEILPMLKQAMPVLLGRFEPVDILVLLIQNPLIQAWLVLQDDELMAIMITQVIQYPRRRCLHIFCLAGTKFKAWFDLAFNVLKEYSHRVGTDQVEVCGRRGWERVFGMEPRSTLLVEDIPPYETSPPAQFREVKGGLH